MCVSVIVRCTVRTRDAHAQLDDFGDSRWVLVSIDPGPYVRVCACVCMCVCVRAFVYCACIHILREGGIIGGIDRGIDVWMYGCMFDNEL